MSGGVFWLIVGRSPSNNKSYMVLRFDSNTVKESDVWSPFCRSSVIPFNKKNWFYGEEVRTFGGVHLLREPKVKMRLF